MDFNSSHKEELNSYLPFGVSKVEIIGFNLVKPEGKSEYIEVGFVTKDGAEDKARVYFSDKSTKFSFNTFRTILVHNVPEASKDKARAAIDAVPNTDKLLDLLATKLMHKEMWVTKYLDPTRTYEKEGNTYQSVNVNIFAYEPKLNEALMPKVKSSETPAQAANAVFGSPEDVPFNDDGSEPTAPAKGADEGWA